jgi:hypothetical protein
VDADWCGQCFADLRPPEREPIRSPVITELPEPATRVKASEAPVSTQAPETGWPCGACGRRNRMELDVCEFCGTPFGRAFDAAEQRPAISPGSAMIWSLAYPGLGHLRAGNAFEAIARAVVFTWSLVTALVFLSVRSGGAIRLVAIAYLLFAGFMYAMTALDARRLAVRSEQVLSSRTLLWITVGLVLFSVASAALVMGGSIQSVGG